MPRICAWCQKKQPPGKGFPKSNPVVTHGICPECAFHVSAQRGLPLREFLDGLRAPVLLWGSKGEIRAANKAAMQLFKKRLPAIEKRTPGEVFGCRYAHLPGGCGQTFHCSGCAIRIAVTDTMKTGRCHLRVPAYLNEEDRTLSLRISTENVGGAVLLRIDRMRVSAGGPRRGLRLGLPRERIKT